MAVKKAMWAAFIVMGILVACGVSVGIYALVAGGGADKQQDDSTLLQGKWQAVTAETDGTTAPAEFVQKIQWRFDKGFLMIKGVVPNAAEVPCTLTLDPAARPKTLDFADFGTKQTVLGIYELRGDTLEVCIITHPRARPTNFKTAPGSGLSRINFVRAK